MHLATTRLSAWVFLFPYSVRVYLIYNICVQLLLLTSQTPCWCYWSSLHFKTVCNSGLSSTFGSFRHYVNTLSHTLTLSPSSTDFLLFLLLPLHISSFLLPFMPLHAFIFRQYRCLFCGTSGRQQALCQIIAQYSPGGFAVHPCLCVCMAEGCQVSCLCALGFTAARGRWKCTDNTTCSLIHLRLFIWCWRYFNKKASLLCYMPVISDYKQTHFSLVFHVVNIVSLHKGYIQIYDWQRRQMLTT